jgi:DNA-binding PadR family transcriptional regulator
VRRSIIQGVNPTVLILTSLANGPKHGYGLARDIEDFSGAKLGPGTLYGAISRLEGKGLIEPAGDDERRRPYRITPAGRAMLAEEAATMASLASEARQRLGLKGAGLNILGLNILGSGRVRLGGLS